MTALDAVIRSIIRNECRVVVIDPFTIDSAYVRTALLKVWGLYGTVKLRTTEVSEHGKELLLAANPSTLYKQLSNVAVYVEHKPSYEEFRAKRFALVLIVVVPEVSSDILETLRLSMELPCTLLDPSFPYTNLPHPGSGRRTPEIEFWLDTMDVRNISSSRHISQAMPTPE